MPQQKPMEPDVKWPGIWEVFKTLAFPISIIVSSGIITHEIRITRIEESRFTNIDGSALENRIKDWVEEKFPPEWLILKLEEMRTELRSINERLRGLESR